MIDKTQDELWAKARNARVALEDGGLKPRDVDYPTALRLLEAYAGALANAVRYDALADCRRWSMDEQEKLVRK
jgi:hypothetical protein